MTRYLPARTSSHLPARTPKLDLVSQVKQDVLDGADLGGELLSSLAKAVMAMAVVGITATAAGNNRIFNAMGAVGSVACGSVVVEELRRKRRWDLLTMIEKATTEDARNAVIAALTERALQYHERGVTVAPSLAPSNLQAFEPIEVAAESYEMAEISDYETEEAAYRTEIESRPIHQTQASPSTLIPAPVFNEKKPVERLSQGEFPFDRIVDFRCLVWVKGAKGSGKTSKVTHIEKLRHDKGQAVWRIDPMPSKASMHRRRGIALYGAQENWAEIEFAVNEFNKLAKHRLDRSGVDLLYSPEDDQHINLSMDEGAVLCQIDKAVLEEFWLHTVVRRIRQANMSVTIGTHGETKRFLGMTNDDCFTGLIDALKEDAIMVQSHTLDSRKPQPFADITYQGRTWRVDCSHIRPHEEVEFLPRTTEDTEEAEGLEHVSPSDLWTDEPQGQPLALTSPRQLAPAQPHTSIAETSALAQSLPTVTRHTLRHPDFPGQQVTITEPELLELLKLRADFRVIVTEAVKRGGSVSGREIQQKAHHNNALKIDGSPMNAQQIRLLLSFLATQYPRSFSLDNSTLTIIDPALMEILK